MLEEAAMHRSYYKIAACMQESKQQVIIATDGLAEDNQILFG